MLSTIDVANSGNLRATATLLISRDPVGMTSVDQNGASISGLGTSTNGSTLWRAIAVFLCTLQLAACANTNVQQIGTQAFPPRASDYKIDVYLGQNTPTEIKNDVSGARSPAEEPPNCATDLQKQAQQQGISDPNANCVIIGRITVTGAPLKPWAGMVEDAKDKARPLGGDAILFLNARQILKGYAAPGAPLYDKWLDFAVIRYSQKL